MKNSVRISAVLLAGLVPTLVPVRAAPRPAPQFQSTCYSIRSLPCISCPGQISKLCVPDPSGPFQSCSETLSSCDETHHCTQVIVDTGPACGN